MFWRRNRQLTSLPTIEAVQTGDIANINSGLFQDHDINEQDRNGSTCLHSSILQGYFHITHLLLTYGADVNIQNNKGETPLFGLFTIPLKKVTNDDLVTLIAAFVVNGADLNLQDDCGNTLLHRAMLAGHHAFVGLLLDNGAQPMPNHTGETPLHLASYLAYNYDENIPLRLINIGNDVNAKDIHGETPLHASIFRSIPLSKTLLEQKADVNMTKNTGIPPILSLLPCSRMKDHYRLLIDYGADINTPFPDGHSILHRALCWNQSDVSMVVEFGANLNLQTPKGYTPLHMGVLLKYHDPVRSLLQARPNLSITDHEGNTALDLALQVGDVDQVQMLAQYKAPFDKLRIGKLSSRSTNPDALTLSALLQIAIAEGYDELVAAVTSHDPHLGSVCDDP